MESQSPSQPKGTTEADTTSTGEDFSAPVAIPAPPPEAPPEGETPPTDATPPAPDKPPPVGTSVLIVSGATVYCKVSMGPPLTAEETARLKDALAPCLKKWGVPEVLPEEEAELATAVSEILLPRWMTRYKARKEAARRSRKQPREKTPDDSPSPWEEREREDGPDSEAGVSPAAEDDPTAHLFS